MRRMIHTLFAIGSAFFVSLLITSCQSEPDTDLNPPPPNVNDSAYLSKIVYRDTVYYGPGMDTSTVYTFTWDAQKRIKTVTFHDYLLGTSTGSIGSITSEWFYNGSDSLPYKLTDEDFERTSFFTYENGYIVKDSMVFAAPSFLNYDGIVNTYTKLGGNRHKVVSRYTLSGAHVRTDTTYGVTTRNADNDIILEKDSIYRDAGMFVLEFRRTYDISPNPLRKTSLPYNVIGIDWNSPWSEWTRKNIATDYSYEKTEMGTEYEQELETFYVYRADGYPVMHRSYELGGDVENVFYYYMRL